MEHLKHDLWKQWVRDHILRPYQGNFLSEFTENDKPLEFSMDLFKKLPELFKEKPEWTKLVFSRMAKCYSKVDKDFFPDCAITLHLVSQMESHGIKLTMARRRIYLVDESKIMNNIDEQEKAKKFLVFMIERFCWAGAGFALCMLIEIFNK